MRLRVSVTLATAALLLAGCVQKPLLQRGPSAPNPFGYLKSSAVCETTPVQKAPDGSLSVSMKVRSDDGLCAVRVQQADGTAYSSFGVSPSPDHGKAFLYNYDDQTYVTYTPTLAYAGADAFTATLIPGAGKTRVTLRVIMTVDATGVTVPTPYKSAPAVAASSKTAKTTTTAHKKRPAAK